MDFKVGDRVWLKSGGPAMTIEAVFPGSREVRCTWMGTASGVPRALSHIYHFDSLVSSEPEPQATNFVPVPPPGKVYFEGDD